MLGGKSTGSGWHRDGPGHSQRVARQQTTTRNAWYVPLSLWN